MMLSLRLSLICLMVLFLVTTLNAQEDADDNDISKLLGSVYEGDLEGITRALASGEDINTQNDQGWTAASFAVAAGDIESLKLLVDNGIDLNIANFEDHTPLMLAAAQADKEMVELLLESNADPLIRTGNDTVHETAYDIAKKSRRLLVAAMILEASAIRCIIEEDSASLSYYIREGAFIDVRTGSGWTPLMFASSYGNLTLANELISLGASIDLQEDEGWTALHFAAVNNHTDIADLLLRSGADIFIANAEDKRAFDLAVVRNNTAIVALISTKEVSLSQAELEL